MAATWAKNVGSARGLVLYGTTSPGEFWKRVARGLLRRSCSAAIDKGNLLTCEETVIVLEVVVVATIVVVGRLRLRQLQAEDNSAETMLLKQAGTDKDCTAERLAITADTETVLVTIDALLKLAE